MSLKKRIIILCIALLLIIGVTGLITILFIKQHNNNSSINVDKIKDTYNNEETSNNNQIDISTSEDEEIKNNNNLDTNQEIQQEETNSKQPTIEDQEVNTSNNNDKQEQNKIPIENNSEENQNKTEKVVCSNNDSEFNSFIAQYKQKNPTFYIVDSLEEAKKFGNDAMNKYGYAYEYNSIPEIFEGTNCIKEIWYVRLSVPKQECSINGVYNDTMYLSANDIYNITNVFDYLRSKGYDCGTKQWYY